MVPSSLWPRWLAVTSLPLSIRGCVVALVSEAYALLMLAQVTSYRWRPIRSPFSSGGFEPTSECSAFFMPSILTARTEQSQLLVGDALRSCALLSFDIATEQLVEHARDHSSFGIAAVASIDADMLLAAESELNVYSLQVGKEVNADGREAPALMPAGMFHLGEFVNKFVQGAVARSSLAQDG